MTEKLKIKQLDRSLLLITNTILAILFSIVSLTSSYAEQTKTNSVTLNTDIIQAPDAERQKELSYIVLQDCGSCHGMTLKGGLGPSLEAYRLSVLPKQYLMEAVTHGRKNTPMPPWGPLLTQGEIQWIVEQLQLGRLEKPGKK